MATASEQQAAALLVVYQQATARLRDQITAFIRALWLSLGTYRNDQMAAFTAQLLPVLTGAEQQMANLTTAYLAQTRSLTLGVPFLPPAVNPKSVTGSALRNGTDPQTVYERPFHLVWRQLAAGTPVDDAIQAGLDRAEQSALTDLQLAKTATSQQVLDRDKRVSGYRRVLEGAHSCALCVLASTQRYHKGALLPIHPACDCGVQPIYGDRDPGQVIDEARLQAAHDAVTAAGGKADPGGRGPTDYRSVLITHDHGELGPVLAIRGRPFRGPTDIH